MARKPSPKSKATPKKTGRPKVWTGAKLEAAMDEIERRIASGQSLKAICESDPTLPHRDTVRLWSNDKEHPFHARYARACDRRVDTFVERLLEVSEGTVDYQDGANATMRRMEADNLKWLLSKLRPEKYGEHTQSTEDITVKVLPAEASDAV